MLFLWEASRTPKPALHRVCSSRAAVRDVASRRSYIRTRSSSVSERVPPNQKACRRIYETSKPKARAMVFGSGSIICTSNANRTTRVHRCSTTEPCRIVALQHDDGRTCLSAEGSLAVAPSDGDVAPSVQVRYAARVEPKLAVFGVLLACRIVVKHMHSTPRCWLYSCCTTLSSSAEMCTAVVHAFPSVAGKGVRGLTQTTARPRSRPYLDKRSRCTCHCFL